jgi:hypothetical protein
MFIHLYAFVGGAAAVRSESERPVLHGDGDGDVVGDVGGLGWRVRATAGDQPVEVVPVVGGGAAGSGNWGFGMRGEGASIGGPR